MSLLLDALKRAEQEKLTRGDRPGAEAAERPSAPTPAVPALELQPLQGAAPQPAPRGDAQAAQAIFKAKAASEARGNRAMIWAAAAAVVVVVLAAGGYYVWRSIQSLAPRAQVATLGQSAPIRPITAAALSPAPGAEFKAPEASAPASALPAPPAPAAPEAKPAPEAAERTPIEALLRQPPPAAEAPVRLAPTREERPRVPADVKAGYGALVAGNLAAARAHYAAALEADATNVDAQLGLATVEARGGNRTAAAALYRRALELDPRNATALAGLAALADSARPEAVEAELRADIVAHPDSAALELTLGNVYASQLRWSEAQGAYFEAYRLEPENADVAYNLAVTLDHLGQRSPAAEFYRRALEGRRDGAAQFDAAAAARRLAELTR